MPANPATVGFATASLAPTVYVGNLFVDTSVVLKGHADGEVTVDYATSDGTATAYTDYTPVSGTLDFEPGQTSQPIDIPILGGIGDPDNTFSVTLSNPSGASLGTATQTITFTVANPVSLSAPGGQSNYDGDTVSLPLNATDTLGNSLSYSETGLPPGLSINSSTGVISGTIASDADAGGPYSVTVTATDGAADVSASQTFSWAVSQPTITLTSPADQSNYDGDTVWLGIAASEDAGHALTFSATGLPSGLSINSSTGVISGTVASDADAFGPCSVTVSVADSAADVSASQTFIWAITQATITLTSPGDQNNYDGDTVSLAVTVSDYSGHALAFSATGLPSGLSIDENGDIAGTIASNADQGGPYSVAVTATDIAAGVSASQTFAWAVSPVVVNLANPGEQTSYDGDQVVLQLAATDSAGHALAYSVDSSTFLPPGLSLDGDSGVVWGTIADDADAGGPYAVIVTASDPAAGASDTEAFVWSVAPVSVSLSNPGNQSNCNGDPVCLDLAATDSAGNTLVFSAAGLPPGLSMGANGFIAGTIASNADTSIPYEVTVTAADGATGVSAAQSFTWAVSASTGATPAITAVSLDEYSVIPSECCASSGCCGSAGDDVMTAQVATANPNGAAVTYQYVWSIGGQVLQTDSTANITDTIDLSHYGDGFSGAEVSVAVTLLEGGTVVSEGAGSSGDLSSPSGAAWTVPERPAGRALAAPASTVFRRSSYFFVSGEGAPEDFVVGQVAASSLSGNPIAYRISRGSASIFKITNTGQIQVSVGSLPLTATRNFFLTVGAADSANPGAAAYQDSVMVWIVFKPTVVISGDNQGVVSAIDGISDNIDLKFVRIGYNLGSRLTVPYTITWNGFNPALGFTAATATALAAAGGSTGRVTFAAGQSVVEIVLVPTPGYYYAAGSANFNVELTATGPEDACFVPRHDVPFYLPSMVMNGYDNSGVYVYDGTCLFASQNDTAGLADTGASVYAYYSERDSTVNINDIRQGGIGDCAFLAVVAEIALSNPQFIHNAIRDNGNGTATVNFFPTVGGAAVPVTVSMALTNSYWQAQLSGDYQFEDDGAYRAYEIWPQILEKAFAAFQATRGGSIVNTWAYEDWQWLTGRAATNVDVEGTTLTASAVAAAINGLNTSGAQVVVSSKATATVNVDGVNYRVYGSHAYALLGITLDEYGNEIMVLYNPWGGDPYNPRAHDSDISSPVIDVPLADFSTYFRRYQYQRAN